MLFYTGSKCRSPGWKPAKFLSIHPTLLLHSWTSWIFLRRDPSFSCASVAQPLELTPTVNRNIDQIFVPHNLLIWSFFCWGQVALLLHFLLIEDWCKQELQSKRGKIYGVFLADKHKDKDFKPDWKSLVMWGSKFNCWSKRIPRGGLDVAGEWASIVTKPFGGRSNGPQFGQNWNGGAFETARNRS